MKPKVIKTEEEYQAFCEHAHSLMDAEAGSPEGEELELFSVLIEIYEKEHYPIPDNTDLREGIKEAIYMLEAITPYLAVLINEGIETAMSPRCALKKAEAKIASLRTLLKNNP